MSCIGSTIGRAIQTPVDSITFVIEPPVDTIALAIEAAVDAVAFAIQPIIDAVTTLVEAVFDAVAAGIDAISDGIGILRQDGIGYEYHTGDQQTEPRCIPYTPCVHVLTP